jgi:hypothetical protein
MKYFTKTALIVVFIFSSSLNSQPDLTKFSQLITFLEELDAIQKVKITLFSNPDPAADQLVIVLEEISKIYIALDKELARYLSLSLDTNMSAGDLDEVRTILLDIVGGSIQVKVSEARGHCTKIENIYESHLNGWFNKVLAYDEYQKISRLFLKLNEFDGIMVKAMEGAAEWVIEQADTTLDYIDNDKLDKANNVIKNSRQELSEYRLRMTKAMVQLRTLQSEFIQAARVVH